MSSNSWPRIFATAPIVRAFRGRDALSLRGGTPSSVAVLPIACLPAITAISNPLSLLQVAQLVLADLDLVAVVEAVRLDPSAVDVGAIQRAQVVDVIAVLAVNQERVI